MRYKSRSKCNYLLTIDMYSNTFVVLFKHKAVIDAVVQFEYEALVRCNTKPRSDGSSVVL